MKKIFSVISSMKLALILFVLIIALSILATFIPQDREAEFYEENYPSSVSGLILALRLHRFYRSALFLVPLGGFFVNLSACSLRRIVRRARAGAKKRYGPDVIHVSILLLIVVGILSIFLTASGQALLGQGEELRLPGGYTVRADRLEQITYEDGRPKDWLTHVSVFKGGDVPIREHVIEVNKPLRIGAYKVYQYTFSTGGEIIVSDSAGNRGVLAPADGFRLGDRVVIARSIETTGSTADGVSVLFETLGSGKQEFFKLGEGDSRFGFSLEEVALSQQSGLLIRYNPLFPVILGLLLVFIGGLALTFIQKLGDKEP